MKMSFRKENSGITLVALVVTIVVLLILAGVSLNLVLGDNGLITKAKEARDKTNKATEDEQTELAELEKTLESEFDYKADTWNEEKKICEPKLGKNMIAVYWTDKNKTLNSNGKYKAVAGNETAVIENSVSTAVEVTSEDSKFDWDEWYDYVAGDNNTDTKTSRWANAKSTKDGSYFVWIPRYEYKILSNEHKAETGKIDINFISASKQTPTSGYKIHPAFTANTKLGGWDSNISGIWVAKYEMSMEQTTDNGSTWKNVATTNTTTETSYGNQSTNSKIRAVSKPNVYAWSYITVGKSFTNGLGYTANSNTGANSHLMKNSEWGCMVYLAHSKYGRNGNKVEKNDYKMAQTGEPFSSLTGFSTTTFNPDLSTEETSNKSNWYNGQNGMKSSTTGNIYGIYDTNGGNLEFISGIYSKYGNSNLSALYNNIGYTLNSTTLNKVPNNSDSSKYVTVYPATDKGNSDANIALHYADWSSMYGDAMYEVSSEAPGNTWNNGTCGDENDWNNGINTVIWPALVRGGAGYFSFSESSDIFAFRENTGEESNSIGYRIALICK